ncbi:malto-oligosyltrehalose synthase [Herbiconiux sp. CPCC 203407]|uniref:Malto-oligosyltrehalose synthase n=1 Tax=Herbiconiux oxytropis TaxID=2970915 RepID=A0AA41XA35_9MICO|nr:malto-oligosyltrehalose synthase [Herbiconiux oxytropis]MCS5720915.1 malto-oligosyltrehalose synthase [Herbiconiux oxytropis]MCS5724392.1 malto-oligosyltrehalose synthase [Herbiconiux oxytropis]
MRIPRSTYRLQLTSEFTLWDAARLVPYVKRLGADWVYLSPILQAEEGSQHGYDVTDHSRVDESRGGPDALRALSEAAHDAGMGVLVDIVPNHVGVATPSQNPWWWDLLKNGQGSRYAEAFDVDWEAGGGRLLLPVLGDDSLEALTLETLPGAQAGGERVLAYYDNHYPIAPGTADDGADAQTVHSRQHYELVNWRRESTDLNYRRFFAVSTLAAVRVEEPWVFDESHAEIARWFREGLVDGLRVDHPDGLADPGGYIERLSELTGGAYILIEKILEGDEPLEPDWPSAGTTGYDALAGIDRVFVDPAGEAGLDALDRELRGDTAQTESGTGTAPTAAEAYAELIHTTKRGIADGILQAEARRLTRDIERAGGLPTRTESAAVTDAVAELLTCFPVYRSYLPAGREHLEHALESALRHRPDIAPVLSEVAEVLGRTGTAPSARFQQTSGMVMAKGVEDTAFYRFTRLTSLTEVGADPDVFSLDVDAFHRVQQHRLAVLPGTMTTLSTHDTKRSEDTRARITALAEDPAAWVATLHELRDLVSTGDGPFDNLLWQAIVGAWPLSRERAHAYAEKASREAGDSTAWLDVNEAFEERMHAAVDAAYDDQAVAGLVERQLDAVIAAGRSNALSAKLVQLTTTGVPDVYQGTELWDHSLVDPDNRRPVDYGLRSELLTALDSGESPSHEPALTDDLGALKLLVVASALRLRRDRPDLFDGYTPLEARGSAAKHLVAFDRGGAVTLATRLPLGLDRHGGWDDTTVELHSARNGYVDALTGRLHPEGTLRISDALKTYPVALLQRVEDR